MGAFAAELRRRDLMISFGVLSLLVVSMAMLIITSYRAQRLAKLQMNFVTTISHELRTPLTVISSAADNIAHGVVEGKQQLAAVRFGDRESGAPAFRAGRADSSVRSSARRPAAIQLPPVAGFRDHRSRARQHRGTDSSAQCTVEQDVEPGLPRVMGDLSALSQCLQNLITNALKYGADQPWIGIRACGNEHGPVGREVEIQVSDRGMGIASGDLPHIFEPFYRSSSVTAAQIRGTGLGLPLAKSIAEAMKGALTVTSTLGQGSTFTLHLPCAEPSPRAGRRAGRPCSCIAANELKDAPL